MGIERHGDHWRWVGGPVPPGSAAITIGPLVSLRRRAAGDQRLVRHELVHVEQWRRHGVVGFLARYLGAYGWWRLRGHGHQDAYRRIPFEIQASWRSRTEAVGPSPGSGVDQFRKPKLPDAETTGADHGEARRVTGA